MRARQTTDFFTLASIGLVSSILAGCNTTDTASQDDVYAPLDGVGMETSGMPEHLSDARAARGRLFLAENKLKPGVVTLPSGLQYMVIEDGDGKTPTLKDTVVTHYHVSSITGREIDDSEDYGEPQEFRVDKVIAGWREALQEMKEGARWKLFVPAELAYGERGLAQIPGGETLIYEWELLGVKPGEAAVADVAEDVPAPPSDLDLGVPTSDETLPPAGTGTTLSGLDQPEPGSVPRRGDLSLDNLDLLD